jgi:malonyl-CoA decarboxylase
MSFLGDMLSAIAERGRAIIDFSNIVQTSAPEDQLVVLCERLMGARGESGALATAAEILSRYGELDAGQRLGFFTALREGFGPDEKALLAAARHYAQAPDQAGAEALHGLSEPRRQRLFRLLNQTPRGTAGLIEMRADLLAMLRDNPQLDVVDRDFQHLFRSWFNRGFLELRRMDWDTPAAILERIIRYEAVHEIADWDDLRRRIDPPDRRLYAFFHPRLKDEPLIFVEVALTRATVSSIGEILAPDRSIVPAADADTAVFYSISDCQPGLRGISFGSFLIKQVVEELRHELPDIASFVTLSPVPGFAAWLARQPVGNPETPLGQTMAMAQWWRDPLSRGALEQDLCALAAHYLIREKSRSGRPLDPVARFHLGNGARLERINWLANTGPSGMAASHGIMVNYLYKLDEIERNHEQYASGQDPAASAAVRRLANAGGRLAGEAVETGGGAA